MNVIDVFYNRKLHEYSLVGQKAKKGIVPIDIQREHYVKLQELSKTKSQSLRRFANEVIKEYIETDIIKEKYFPELKKIGFQDNIMYIDDINTKEVAKISLDNSKLTCTLHAGTNVCEHILYAAMCSDINKLVSPLL